jgi:hypothetical protein
MKRALTTLAALVLATAGILVTAAPAVAQELAVCEVNSQVITIDTASNTAELEYYLYCPIAVGYQAPVTAWCTGEGSGDRSSLIAAWTDTEDACSFSDGGGYIGVAIVDITRQYVLTPVLALAQQIGGGIAIEGVVFVPSIQNTEVTGNFSVLGNELRIDDNELVPAPFVFTDE